ncbi:MAG TPA: hypothetical protein VGA78_10255 [Gemmatimonadales bacterium]|jgi:flagellar biosynthesis/type III secretory pathway M-ring protein FliF/YscJ
MIVLVQVEQTPLPPLPPQFPEAFPPELAIIAGLAIILGGIILIIVARAVARRLEGKGGAELRAEIDGLHQRVAELEQVEQRMAELENRMEFSERLLTQQRDALPERGNRT